MTALPGKIVPIAPTPPKPWQIAEEQARAIAQAAKLPIDAATAPDAPPKTNGTGPPLEPDREQIATFVRGLFKHAAPGTYVSLRSFYDDDSDKSFEIQCVAVDNRDDVIERAYHQAKRAANAKRRIVFCPPTATFSNTAHAGKADVADGLELSAECDAKPQAARALLEKMLGPPTIAVESGGEWLNTDTGELEPKLHLHWRLRKPAREDDRVRLEEARKFVIDIVGSDPSHAPICHPIRWPGSTHRKGEPKLCRIVAENPEREIDLYTAHAALKAAAPAINDNPTRDDAQAAPPNWGELIGKVLSSESYHVPLTRLAAKLLAAGMHAGAVVTMLQGWMEASAGPRDARWQARYDDIPRAVSTAQETFGKVAAPSMPLKIVSAATLAGKPAPSRVWHVPGLIPAHTVTNFSGDGGVGKSLAALQLAASTALNREWLGHSVRGGAALYMSAEDDMDELHRRLAHIADAYGVTLAELGSLHLLPYAGFDAVLASLTGRTNQLEPTPLWHQVKQAVGDLKPTLVVFDTLSDVFAGDEIKRVQARQFVGMLRGLAIEHDLTSMLLSHPSLTGMSSGTGSSGSTGWNNAFRSRYYLERIFMEGQGQIEADPDLRKFTNKKINYGRLGYEMTLRWHDGVFVRETGTESNSGQGALGVILEAEVAFLDLVGRYGAEGRAVSAAPGPNYAPTMFARDPRGKGTAKRAFTTAMNRLFQAGKIANEQFGPPSKRRTRLVLVTGAN
jgi:RecA-family ATPase